MKSQTPVFVINGFLEGGKTQFMKFTMQQEYFMTEGKTLLIICEDGEEQYDSELLDKTNTTAVFFEEQSDVTAERLRELELAYQPERVLLEWNGIWPQNELAIPDEWFINQMVTLIDTSTLDLYIKNMKALMGPMLKDSELIICNRADDIPEETLAGYQFLLRTMSPKAEIVFEGKQGEIRGDFSIELPYDLNDDIIQITSKDYGIFYVDSMDRTDKYDGKIVEFTAQVLKPRGIPEGCFVPGRRVMTCCEADIQFMGLFTYYKGAAGFKNRDWVRIRGTIKKEHCEAYGGVGPVLYAESVVLTGPVNEVVQFV